MFNVHVARFEMATYLFITIKITKFIAIHYWLSAYQWRPKHGFSGWLSSIIVHGVT